MKERTVRVDNDGAQQIVVYKPSERIRMEVKTDGETVWLTQEQMCQLFGRERSVITKHVRNVFRDGELVPEAVCAKFAHTAPDGKVYQVVFYDSIEHNVKRIGDGVSYLVKQMSTPQVPVRRRIGFGASETDKPAKPYGKLQQ